MGPYCKFCDFRCFVSRVLADGRSMLLATCLKGMEHDRRTVGQDHITAINPVTDREAVGALRSAGGESTEVRDVTELREQILAAEAAAEAALKRAPRPFGQGNDGAKHLENALAELRRARVYADAYVDVAREDAGLPR